MAKLTKKALEKFPQVMFVSKKSDRDTEWFDAQSVAADCLEDDGPELVAHYKLTGIYKLQKAVRTVDNVLNK